MSYPQLRIAHSVHTQVHTPKPSGAFTAEVSSSIMSADRAGAVVCANCAAELGDSHRRESGEFNACGLCKQERVPEPAIYCGKSCARAHWKSEHKAWHEQCKLTTEGYDVKLNDEFAEKQRALAEGDAASTHKAASLSGRVTGSSPGDPKLTSSNAAQAAHAEKVYAQCLSNIDLITMKLKDRIVVDMMSTQQGMDHLMRKDEKKAQSKGQSSE